MRALLVVISLFAFHFASAATPRLAPALEQQARIKNIDDQAEVLYALEKSEFAEDGSWQHIQYYSIRISSIEAARDYGRIVIPFDHYYSDINLDFANARAVSGQITPLALDAVQHRITGGGQDFYSDSSELVFSLPNVVPGSIIEFQFTQTSKELAFPELYADSATPWYFQRKVGGDGWRGDTVRHYEYELSAPADKKLHIKYYNGFPEKPKKTKVGNKIIRRWTWTNVEPFHSEVWMAPFDQVASMLRVSTHTDWSVVDAWTWKKVADKLKPTKELKAIIAAFNLPKQASREEKIRAVYAYMQSNIRYVFAHLGRGGYEPHSPTDVAKANYGDCKDQSVLSVALLRMMGVNAFPALVETNHAGKSDNALVELIFDHMIVYIPEDNIGPAMYMDTTGDHMLYPGVSNYLKGQNTLIVDGKGGTMTHLTTDFSPSFAHLHINYDINRKQQTTAEIEIELSGFFEQNMRSWWISSNDRESNLNNFVKGLFSSSLDSEVKASFLNAEDIWQAVKIKALFTFTEPDNEQHTRAASFSQLNFLFGSGALPLPETRKHDFFDNTEYNLYMTVNFLAIENLKPVLHTQGKNQSTPWFDLSQKGFEIADGYRVNISYKKHPHDLSKKEYARYYDAYTRLATAENWLIAYDKESSADSQNQLAALKDQHGEAGFEYLLALAENNINNGEFEQALEPARKAVALNHNSGHAWYVLALAQGFNSNVSESKTAFAKARALGYTPW